MSYIRYDINVNESLYQSYEEIRKKFKGDHLCKTDIEELLGEIGFPMKSPRMWELLKECELIFQKGKARYTYYLFPIDQPPYDRFERLEKEYYNGMSRIKNPKKQKPMEKEIGRIALTEDFCIDFLKKRNYVVFKVEPDFNTLAQVINPEFLLQNSKAKLK